MLRKCDTCLLSFSQLEDVQTHIRENQQERACSWGMRAFSGQRAGLLTHCTLVFGWKARIILGTQTRALLALWVIIPLSWSLLQCLENCICTTSAQGSWICDRYLKLLPWNKTALIEISQRQGTGVCNWVLVFEAGHVLTAYILPVSAFW